MTHRNEDLYKAMQEKRRSSAASPHDSRPNRQRTRRDSKRAAIREGRGSSVYRANSCV